MRKAPLSCRWRLARPRSRWPIWRGPCNRLMILTTMVNMTAMLMVMQVREDEEVKAQLIQRIDNLTADNDCLKSEMDLVRRKDSYTINFACRC